MIQNISGSRLCSRFVSPLRKPQSSIISFFPHASFSNLCPGENSIFIILDNKQAFPLFQRDTPSLSSQASLFKSYLYLAFATFSALVHTLPNYEKLLPQNLSETIFNKVTKVNGLLNIRPYHRASLLAKMEKNLPTMWETQVPSLRWKHPLEKGMSTHSIILAGRIPWTEEPGRLPYTGLQRLIED